MFAHAQNVVIYGGHFENKTEVHHNASVDHSYGPSPAAEKRSLESLSHWEALDNPRCTEGTRNRIISNILQWINLRMTTDEKSGYESHEMLSSSNSLGCVFDSSSPNLLWLVGKAGTGKTTLASTIADICYGEGVLGGSFFAKSNVHGRNDAKSIFPQLAQQFSQHSHAYGKAVERSLQDQHLLELQFDPQLVKLFVMPLRKSRDHVEPSVFIIDALDECQDWSASAKAFGALVRQISKLSPLRFLVTSRRIQALETVAEGHSDAIYTLDMDEENPEEVTADIQRFLSHGLRSPHGWRATDEEIIRLASAANGLFIYAATCVQIVTGNIVSDFRNKLENLLKYLTHSNSSLLSSLYTRVLSEVPHYESEPDQLANFNSILAAVVLLRRPMPIESLARLLGFETTEARKYLSAVYSVVHVPRGSDDADAVVRVFHESFSEFIQDPRQCTRFCVIPQAQHPFFASRCIHVLKTRLEPAALVARHACQLVDFTETMTSSRKLTYRNAVPPDVQYAAQFWGYHLCAIETLASTDDILKSLLEILQSPLILTWIEVSASMGGLKMALSNVVSVSCALENQAKDPFHQPSPDCLDRLRRTEQWLHRFYTIIDETPLQVSHLIFSPFPLDRISDNESWIKEISLPGMETQTCFPEREIKANGSTRSIVTFIDDSGDEFILSATEKRLYIFDVLTGQEVSCLAGHRSAIWSVAVSPDMKFAASASTDKSVKVWDLRKGLCLRTIAAHENIARAVAWSHDQRFIASGGLDRKVRVWKVEDEDKQGLPLFQAEHGDAVKVVSFSADGQYVISGSADQTLCVWALPGMDCVKKFGSSQAPIVAASFSPRAETPRVMACANSGGLVYMWTANDWSQEPEVFEEYDNTHQVTCLSFSTDGSQLAFIVEEPENPISYIHVFGVDARSGNRIVARERGLRAITFSRDGRKIITSGGGSGSISIWSLEPTISNPSSNSAGQPISQVVFSPSGEHLLACSIDGSVMLWDMKGPPRLLTKVQRPMPVHKAVFSPDNRLIVIGDGVGGSDSPLSAGTLCLIEVGPNALPQHLTDSAWPVDCIAFSPDGEYIAYSLEKAIVQIWSLQQERVTARLWGFHRTHVMHAMTFSADGSKITTVAADGHVALWDVKIGHPIGSFRILRHSAAGVAFTSDGGGIIGVTPAGAVGLFDAERVGLVELVGGGAVQSWTSVRDPNREKLLEFLQAMEVLKENQLIGGQRVGDGPENEQALDFGMWNASRVAGYLADSNRYQRSYPSLIILDDWLWCMKRNRRIMPVPQSLKVSDLAQGGNLVAIGSRTGMIYVLEISQLVEQLDAIDLKKAVAT